MQIGCPYHFLSLRYNTYYVLKYKYDNKIDGKVFQFIA